MTEEMELKNYLLFLYPIGPVAYPDSYRENKVSGLWAEKV
jgi:hypothetical protein